MPDDYKSQDFGRAYKKDTDCKKKVESLPINKKHGSTKAKVRDIDLWM